MNVFPAAISTALAMAFIAAGCNSARAFYRLESRLLFADRYHRYVMQAEREMYEDSHLRGVICNAEMIKREIIEDFGLPAEKIHVIYNAIDNQRFLPPDERLCRHAPKWQLPLQATCLIYAGSGFERGAGGGDPRHRPPIAVPAGGRRE